MSISLTSHRYNIIKDDNLPLPTKQAVIKLLDKEIGYPAPMELIEEMNDQADDQSPLSGDAENVRDYDFHEIWHKGAGFSSSPLEWRGIIFHHTAGTIAGTVDHLTKRTKSASYHCMISEEGNRHRFVSDHFRAYHAGRGTIHGRNPNHVCLSIAFNGDTVSGKWRKQKRLNDKEIESTLEFLRPRWNKFSNPWSWISDHRTVDPTRRNDLHPEALEQILTALRKEFGE